MFMEFPSSSFGISVGLLLFAFFGLIGKPSLAPRGIVFGTGITMMTSLLHSVYSQQALRLSTTTSSLLYFSTFCMNLCIIYVVYWKEKRLIILYLVR